MRHPSINHLAALFVSALFSILVIAPALAQSPIELPQGFVYEKVIEKLDGPTSFAFSPDGRIFITQKAGAVKVFHNGALLRENFIDLSDQVNQHADRGLMSVAVHPSFPSTPYVYFAYVYEPPNIAGAPRSGGRVSRVIRVSADPTNPNRHQPGSEVVILGQNSTLQNIGNPSATDQPPFSCANPDGAFVQDCLPADSVAHVVNHMIFGRDGSLFIANGDGTDDPTANPRAQQIDSLAGKILRIDPITGQGYANNPFFDGNLASNRSKVYALGLRNPFRIALNPQTGALMVGEVGNNTWEELSLGFAGANFGWPCFEGPDQASLDPVCDPLFSGAVPTVQAAHQYRHAGGFGAAIGGDFYFGNQFPSQFNGAYFFSDYPASVIQYLTFNGGTFNGGAATVNNFASSAWKIVQTQSAPDGSLYILSIGRGELGRISYPAGRNNPSPAPQAQAQQPQPVQQPQPQTRTLDVVIQRVQPPTAEAVAPEISRNVPPQAIILEPSGDIVVDVGTTIQVKGQGLDEVGTLTGSSLKWEGFLHHKDHVHFDFFEATGSDATFTFADHGDNTYIELCLTATDPAGATDKSCVDIQPKEVTYTFRSQPSGQPLLYGGTRYTTPFDIVTQVGASRFIAAPSNPTADLTFAGWSNFGQRQQRIAIQDTPETITAIFAPQNETGEISTFSQPTLVPQQPVIEQPLAEQPFLNIAPPANDPLPATQTGSILREWWRNVKGQNVSDLIDSRNFPNRPSGSELIDKLEGPALFGDNYGTRIRGYVHPPVSGTYLFWIASDDSSQLWLSTDDSSRNKVLIAQVTHWTPRQKWFDNIEQASAPFYLEAGKKYYIEVLHKEAAQKDNVAVAWQVPGGDVEVIEGQYLSPPNP